MGKYTLQTRKANREWIIDADQFNFSLFACLKANWWLRRGWEVRITQTVRLKLNEVQPPGDS